MLILEEDRLLLGRVFLALVTCLGRGWDGEWVTMAKLGFGTTGGFQNHLLLELSPPLDYWT